MDFCFYTVAHRGKSGKIALKGYFLSVYLSGGLKQGKTPVITGLLDQKYPFLGQLPLKFVAQIGLILSRFFPYWLMKKDDEEGGDTPKY